MKEVVLARKNSSYGLIVPNLHGAPALVEGSNSGFRYGFPSEW